MTKKDSGSRARGHVLLIPDRPTCVTILSLGTYDEYTGVQNPHRYIGDHGWVRFRSRLSLSFDFSHVIFACEKKREKERGNEANLIVPWYISNQLNSLCEHTCIVSHL